MTVDDYNQFCGALAHTHHVVQWGNAEVWKVADKVFAVGGWNDGEEFCVTFKCSKISFELLKEQEGLRPAPYLASRGFTWIQRTSADYMDDEMLQDYLKESYRLVSLGLTKKKQKELGLNQSEASRKKN